MHRILQAIFLLFSVLLLVASYYFVMSADIAGAYSPGPAPAAPGVIAANNVAGFMACGCAIACGLALLATALHLRLSGSPALIPPALLLWVCLGMAALLFASAFNIAFKDAPFMTRTADGIVQAVAPNTVDALGGCGLVVAGGLSLVAVAVLPGRMHATHATSG
jgi:hypothetical protein